MRRLAPLLTLLGFAPAYAENAILPANCEITTTAVVRYLNQHGVSTQFSKSDPTFGLVSKHILDANGKQIDTLRARLEFASTDKRDWLAWSPGALRAGGSLILKPDEKGCSVDLKIWFDNHSNVTFILFIPVDGGMLRGSNGKLEHSFFRAIAATLPKEPASN